MKGGFAHDNNRHHCDHGQFKINNCWIHSNASRIFPQQHSLMNVARQWF
jgi:hypothetical protein